MVMRAAQPQTVKAAPFLLAPGKTKSSAKFGSPKQSGSKSPPSASTHSRKTSDVPHAGKDIQQKSAKGSPRSSSPKSPFSDLGAMLEFLSKKGEKSPYHMEQPRKSLSPKTAQSPKTRSPKTLTQRQSVAPQNRVQMQVLEGVVKAPKLYENQIFRDVFDSAGQHDKELYSSFTDSSLEIYQERTDGGGFSLAPRQADRPQVKVAWPEKLCEVDSARAPDTTKIEEGRSTPRASEPDFDEELWRKLARLQEARNNSQSETACEEVRDSRK